MDNLIQEYIQVCSDLYREVRDKLGPPPKERVAFWVPDANSDLAHGKVNWSVEEQEITHWDQYSFPMYQRLENQLAAGELIEGIARLTGIYEGRIRFVLTNVALRTGLRAQRGSRKRLLRELRPLVTRRVEDDPGPSLTRAFVIGGSVKGRRKLDGRTVLRPPRASDLAPVVFDRFNPGRILDQLVPHCVLEARYGEGERPEGDEVRGWLDVLRLATGLPLLVPVSHHIPTGPTAFGMGSTVSSPHVGTNYPPVEIPDIGIQRARKLRDFVLTDQLQSFVEAAMDRLARSIQEPSSVPQRLLYAVMGFEALLLGEESGQTQALANRLAVLVGYPSGKGKILRDRIRAAYGLRSRYVHGGDFKPKDTRKLGEVYPALRQDLCLSIVAAMASGLPKRGLLTRLDEALVDPETAARFHNGLRDRFLRLGLGDWLGKSPP